MANTVKLQLQNEKGKWCTWGNVVVPVKFGKLLDEQLDYATVSLERVKKQEIPPLTRAKLTITSDTPDVGVQGDVFHYLVASDDYYESPVGTGIYNHSLTLIELTKFLECFPLETLCFTNPNGNIYTDGATYPLLTAKIDTGNLTTNGEEDSAANPDILDETAVAEYRQYKTPMNPGKFVIHPLRYKYHYGYDIFYLGYVTIENNLGEIVYKRYFNEDGTGNLTGTSETGGEDTEQYKVLVSNEDGSELIELSAGIVNLDEGTYIVTYTYKTGNNLAHLGYNSTYNQFAKFEIKVMNNKAPLRPWTVNDVVQRVLQLVEPIRFGQTPRFSFTPPTDSKAKLFSQFAPEFTFTRQTLREALQTVGGFIHAEPRLTENDEIVFDYYGEQEYATYTNYKTNKPKRLSEYKYKAMQGRRSVEQACNRLDSYQDNLVNRLGWGQATIGQPYKNGVQTLRTETAWIRGEENDSFFFPTAQNVDRIEKFEYIKDGMSYDITPYVYEINVYNNLSSFDETYPTSKSYALYYTQGQKGIKGFFYKVPCAKEESIGKNYSIINILNAKMNTNMRSSDYDELQFRLTYIPIYSTRVQHGKQYIKDYLPLPRTLNYTQADNSVETRFFGENIKGAIERMGNTEKTYTLNFRNFNNIPKAGQLWDDDYYIASVSTSVGADLFEVSVGLSKNFNRKSNYIGANSHKRIYEVSEVMVHQRHTVYNDYIIINTEDRSVHLFGNEGCFVGENMMYALSNMFYKSKYKDRDWTVVAVQAIGQSKHKTDDIDDLNGSPQENVILPVISSAFGNVLEFTWEYKDNFSAGLQMSDIQDGVNDENENIQGKFGLEVEYSDYYGRIYYYYWALLDEKLLSDTILVEADDFPEVSSQSIYEKLAGAAYAVDNPVIERKDSREALRKSYSVELVTDDKDVVIGSAFATKNPLVSYETVNGVRRRPHLYVLKTRVNKFANALDANTLNAGEDLGEVSVGVSIGSPKYVRTAYTKRATISGKAWAYVYPIYYGESYEVEDEYGEVTTVTPELGGEIVFAKNMDIQPDEIVGSFKAIAVHDVYEYLKAKNK